MSSVLRFFLSGMVAFLYTVNPQEKIPDFTIQNFTSASRRSFVHGECELKDTLFQQVVTSICEGDSYAGYTQAGSYTDHFVTRTGCDSIRTLKLDVEACLNTCAESFVTVLGSMSGNEKGYAVAASAAENAVYVAGTINDSVMIIRVKSTGMIDWARKFDVIPGKAESINGMILDASGKLAMVGITGVINTQGNLFVCRYDPVNNVMLWVKEETSTSQGFVSGLIEMGPGGPYLISNNPATPNNAELYLLDQNTGTIIPGFANHYDLGSSESIGDLVLYNGKLFGVGRFTDGPSPAQMRTTLIRMDPNTGLPDFTQLGHRPVQDVARLYGVDLVIVQDQLYYLSLWDDSGTSIDDTKIYVQKADTDGHIQWLKQYELPDDNDWADEMIAVKDGLVIMARNRRAPSDIILIKIDYDGKVIWGRKLDYASNDNSVSLGGISSQMVALGDFIYFTAYAEENGNYDLLLAKVSQDGTMNDSCTAISAIKIPVNTVNGSVYYKVNPTVFHYQPTLNNRAVSSAITMPLQQQMVCHQPVVSTGVRQGEICEGDALEGYTMTGTYVDTLVSAEGCDSIRTLQLTVVPRSVTQISKTICEGDSYLGHSASGLYTDTLSASSGCDSIRILNLNTTSTFLTTENKTICFGKAYYGHDLTGMYIDTFISAFGCDSIRTLQLDILPEISSQASVTLCEGFTFGYTEPGIYIDTLLSDRGCDSIRTLEVKGSKRYIPNVFSPNGDQVNDVFEIISYPEADLPIDYFAIFDRFGNMAYEKSDGEVKWDGKDKSGQYYNPGVFAYILISKCGGKKVTEHGTITLIR